MILATGYVLQATAEGSEEIHIKTDQTVLYKL